MVLQDFEAKRKAAYDRGKKRASHISDSRCGAPRFKIGATRPETWLAMNIRPLAATLSESRRMLVRHVKRAFQRNARGAQAALLERRGQQRHSVRHAARR